MPPPGGMGGIADFARWLAEWLFRVRLRPDQCRREKVLFLLWAQ